MGVVLFCTSAKAQTSASSVPVVEKYVVGYRDVTKMKLIYVHPLITHPSNNNRELQIYLLPLY